MFSWINKLIRSIYKSEGETWFDIVITFFYILSIVSDLNAIDLRWILAMGFLELMSFSWHNVLNVFFFDNWYLIVIYDANIDIFMTHFMILLFQSYVCPLHYNVNKKFFFCILVNVKQLMFDGLQKNKNNNNLHSFNPPLLGHKTL